MGRGGGVGEEGDDRVKLDCFFVRGNVKLVPEELRVDFATSFSEPNLRLDKPPWPEEVVAAVCRLRSTDWLSPREAV